MECHAFTLSEEKIVNRLKTKVYVFDKYEDQDLRNEKDFIAIWDTGATTTCITKDVAAALNLVPVGTVVTSTAGGDKECNVYCVDIILPNKVAVTNLSVYEVHLTNEDVLIGMDIIKHGDFSITNYSGTTKLSFRIPSSRHIDYVDEWENDHLK